MRLAVLNTSVPFLRGGAEHLADSLFRELRERGHQVEHIKIPLRWATPLDVASSMVAAASLRIPEAERVIALKFPAYLVPHEQKVVWLLHQFRQVYELWGTPLQDMPSDAEGTALRKAIMQADNNAIGGAHEVFCNSSVTAGRLKRFNGISSQVLLAPHGSPTQFESGGYGDYVLAVGRVTSAKRQAMLVDAMAHSTSGIKLVIAGSPETPGDLANIEQALQRHQLDGRVEVIPRFISDQEKVELIAGARAVAYLPVDEDSYGYVTAEAMMSHRPVITAADSGGILELVEDDVTGIVADPNPRSLAAAIDRLATDDALARRLGDAGFDRVEELDLSWDGTIERLLA